MIGEDFVQVNWEFDIRTANNVLDFETLELHWVTQFLYLMTQGRLRLRNIFVKMQAYWRCLLVWLNGKNFEYSYQIEMTKGS